MKSANTKISPKIVKYGFRPMSRNELEGQPFNCGADINTTYHGACPYTTGDEWLTFRSLNNFPIFGDILVLTLFIVAYHFFGFLLTRKRAIESTK